MKRNDNFRFVEFIQKFLISNSYGLKLLLKSNELKILKKNKKFSNIHYNKTCYILGNGPSISLVDNINILNDSLVFTVNQAYRAELFKKVNSNYHVMMDPLFFNLSDDIEYQQESLELIREVRSSSKAKFIFPVDFKKNIIDKKIGFEDDIYIKTIYRIHESYRKKMQMHKYMPRIRNVVQAAVYCAISMGIKEIVLLGVDMTGLLDSYIRRSDNIVEKKYRHSYTYTNNEKKRINEIHLTHNNAFMLEAYSDMFNIYISIKKYCDRTDIKILNGTHHTALDIFEYVDFDELISSIPQSIKERKIV
jgi:hypothetical protein